MTGSIALVVIKAASPWFITDENDKVINRNFKQQVDNLSFKMKYNRRVGKCGAGSFVTVNLRGKQQLQGVLPMLGNI